MKKNYLFTKYFILLLLISSQIYAQGSANKAKKVYVDASRPDNNGNGLTWANAKKDIQSAIDKATIGDEVWIKAGVYYPTTRQNLTSSNTTLPSDLTNRDNYISLKDNVKIYGGFAGTESTLTQRIIGTNVTYIDGDIGVANDNSDNCYHLMIYVGTLSTVGITLDGLVFRNANAQRASANNVADYSTNLSANNSIYSIGRGSAPVFVYQGLNSTFNNIVFENNSSEYTASALYTGGGNDGTNCTYTVSNTYFINNILTTGTYGSWAAENTNINCYNTVFYGNKANTSLDKDGVALFLYGSQASIINSSFIKNESYNGAALGVYVPAESPRLSEPRREINKKASFGDTKKVAAALTTIISNCIFYGTTRNASFTDNKKYDFAVNNGSQDFVVKNSSLEHAQSTYQTANGNELSAGSSGNIFAQEPAFGNINNVKGLDGKYFTADDGLILKTSSPCKNTGLNSEVPAIITTDITGANRKIGSVVDMGPYELDTTLGTSNFALNAKIQVYPNPTSAVLNINMTDFSSAKTTLYDLSGKVLKTQFMDNAETKINISDFSKGIFLLKIETENGSITKQIIKD